MATKKQSMEMTTLQMLQRMVRTQAPAALILRTARKLVDIQMDIDAEKGPVSPVNNDVVQAIWVLAAAFDRLSTENETLRRKLRRDNRRPAKKPQPEMLKKEPEQSPQVV